VRSEPVGELSDLAVLARLAVSVQCRRPRRFGQTENRAADRLGEVKADRKPDLAVAAEVQQLVRQPGAVGPHHDRFGLDELARELLQGVGEHGDVVAGVI